MLNHLKTVPRCWAAVRKAGLISDAPHAGLGSKVRLAEASANPKLVPACPRGKMRLVYDDGPGVQLLPREKEVLLASSHLGGCIEDWVLACEPDADSVTARYQLWQVVQRCLRRFPFYCEEFREVIGLALKDIQALQPKVLWVEARALPDGHWLSRTVA